MTSFNEGGLFLGIHWLWWLLWILMLFVVPGILCWVLGERCVEERARPRSAAGEDRRSTAMRAASHRGKAGGRESLDGSTTADDGGHPG